MVATSGDALSSATARETLFEPLLLPGPCGDSQSSRGGDLVRFSRGKHGKYERGCPENPSNGPPAMYWSRGGIWLEMRWTCFLTEESLSFFRAPRIDNLNTHGTGCTLSAALATFLAQGMTTPAAVAAAKKFISRAIRYGLDLGSGRGPVNHCAG